MRQHYRHGNGDCFGPTAATCGRFVDKFQIFPRYSKRRVKVQSKFDGLPRVAPFGFVCVFFLSGTLESDGTNEIEFKSNRFMLCNVQIR